ncbi:hypothetical protein CDAR_46711 [Caerostris darwini]|uniref:Reverse transcriptase domain-containing protein n=1 Tax=Caerostris darwini TaxID=1538125 RepID=A0AAV4V6D1_9ARAC|nr:hypothetical protein CDAR_46711 [Caerostris darwini]
MIGFGSSILIAVPSGHDINPGEFCSKTLVKRLTSPAPQTTPERKKIPKIQHNSNTGNSLPVSLPPYHMTSVKKELDKLLINGITEKCESTYASSGVLIPKMKGKKIPKIQHNSNTGNNLPVSLPPYHMTSVKKELDKLLINGITEKCESTYASSGVLIPKMKGKKIPKIQHNSNTGNSLPVSLPPYHMTSVKKELDKLLINGITEKCESPYASSCVLIPKLKLHICAWTIGK